MTKGMKQQKAPTKADLADTIIELTGLLNAQTRKMAGYRIEIKFTRWVLVIGVALVAIFIVL